MSTSNAKATSLPSSTWQPVDIGSHFRHAHHKRLAVRARHQLATWNHASRVNLAGFYERSGVSSNRGDTRVCLGILCASRNEHISADRKGVGEQAQLRGN
jgi:hypothetical protein